MGIALIVLGCLILIATAVAVVRDHKKARAEVPNRVKPKIKKPAKRKASKRGRKRG